MVDQHLQQHLNSLNGNNNRIAQGLAFGDPNAVLWANRQLHFNLQILVANLPFTVTLLNEEQQSFVRGVREDNLIRSCFFSYLCTLGDFTVPMLAIAVDAALRYGEAVGAEPMYEVAPERVTTLENLNRDLIATRELLQRVQARREVTFHLYNMNTCKNYPFPLLFQFQNQFGPQLDD